MACSLCADGVRRYSARINAFILLPLYYSGAVQGSFYEKEAARAVNQMIALLEPAMILILALVVGSVVMAIMMPVFNMYSSML